MIRHTSVFILAIPPCYTLVLHQPHLHTLSLGNHHRQRRTHRRRRRRPGVTNCSCLDLLNSGVPKLKKDDGLGTIFDSPTSEVLASSQMPTSGKRPFLRRKLFAWRFFEPGDVGIKSLGIDLFEPFITLFLGCVFQKTQFLDSEKQVPKECFQNDHMI